MSFFLQFFDQQVNTITTKPIEGQKTGTSGLRKKVEFFSALILIVLLISSFSTWTDV